MAGSIANAAGHNPSCLVATSETLQVKDRWSSSVAARSGSTNASIRARFINRRGR